MKMGTSEGDVMWLTGSAGYGVEINMIVFIGDQWRRHIRVVVLATGSVGHEALATPRGRICGRRLTQIPLTHFTILGTGEEEVRGRLGDNPFHSVRVAPVDASVGVASRQIAHATEEIGHASASGR